MDKYIITKLKAIWDSQIAALPYTKQQLSCIYVVILFTCWEPVNAWFIFNNFIQIIMIKKIRCKDLQRVKESEKSLSNRKYNKKYSQDTKWSVRLILNFKYPKLTWKKEGKREFHRREVTKNYENRSNDYIEAENLVLRLD